MNDSPVFLGRPVYSLQTMLRTISDSDSQILPVIPTGTYGTNTYASVKSFQKKFGLAETGSADYQTWQKIVSVYHALQPKRSVPVTELIWEPDTTLSFGEENTHIYLVQAMLTALSHIYSAFPRLALTGKLDSETSDGLQQLQRIAGMEITGTLDLETWYYLNHLYRIAITDGGNNT